MKQDDQMDKIRHSLSHLMSMAIMELYPKTGLGVGPFIENGFYQDYDLPESISSEIFPKLEKRIKQFIKQGIKFEQHAMNFNDALKLYQGDPYKTELIEDLKKAGEKDVSFYKSDWFENLCKGPHVKSTQEINADAFKLTKIAGAYWRGNEKNKMLTRIYGVAFAAKKELDDYLTMMAEAEKRDHRKLGKEMELFVFSDLVGSGMPLYTPKGAFVRNQIIALSNELQSKIGYEEVHTPQVNKADLFKISGHYDKFKNDMLMVKSHYSDEEYFLKPMNCPQHTQLYAAQKRSYRDLPIRFSDTANLFRDEKPGELSGLTRLRCFCQDYSHCFCREDQIETEFKQLLAAVKQALAIYGLDYFVRLSLWDPEQKEKYLGDENIWQKSQQKLEQLLIANEIKFEKAEGEAAFYGPKMDIMVKDALKRQWQSSTIQLDLNMPNRFGLSYTDADGQKKTPVMIHKAIVGSPERFLGILIEHYAGNFPLWLSPIQIKILSVGEVHLEFCQQLAEKFKAKNLRVATDLSDESVGKKIRTAAKEKIPYTLVIGDKEMNSDKLLVRIRGQEDLWPVPFPEFIAIVKKLMDARSAKLQ